MGPPVYPAGPFCFGPRVTPATRSRRRSGASRDDPREQRVVVGGRGRGCCRTSAGRRAGCRTARSGVAGTRPNARACTHRPDRLARRCADALLLPTSIPTRCEVRRPSRCRAIRGRRAARSRTSRDNGATASTLMPSSRLSRAVSTRPRYSGSRRCCRKSGLSRSLGSCSSAFIVAAPLRRYSVSLSSRQKGSPVVFISGPIRRFATVVLPVPA